VPQLYAFRARIRPGLEDGYDETHARLPDEVVEAHLRAGIHDWKIWRYGRELFHLVECDDVEAAFRSLDEDPANARWQETIGPYVESFDAVPLHYVFGQRDQTG